MKRGRGHIDMLLAGLMFSLIVLGALIFASAAFGFLARGSTHVSSVVFNHLALGIGLGTILLIAAIFIDYHVWRRFAPYLFALALIATALVFVPHVGMEHGGGKRWISIARVTFQPSEALKIATIVFASAYFAWIRSRIEKWQYGLVGLIAILGAPSLILLVQPDLGTLGVIVFSTMAIFFAAGARWRDICTIICLALVAGAMLAYMKPYVRDRITTFFDPSKGQQAESYQIKQSLIAIGSGGIFGRGFGQGIQKFTYLPEPMGDSIFAVASEELGFVGSTGLVLLFLALVLRGYTVASRAADHFGGLMAVGISTYLASEAFINIAAMLGAAPLTGIPLTFISQGGSAMLISLGSAGILLNISSHRSGKTSV